MNKQDAGACVAIAIDGSNRYSVTGITRYKRHVRQGGQVRTDDNVVPSHGLYRTELHPDSIVAFRFT